jgi:arylsulfatase A-like enzyme
VKSKHTITQISRRTFIRQSAIGTAGLTASLVCSGCTPKGPPNIIFLLTDDQRWDTFGAAGNQVIKTPNMDRLAAEGVMFKNAFVTTSICMSSRASIFLGQYERRHQINDFAKDFTPQQLANTYPMLLKKQGYTVAFIGKYGVGSTLPKEHYDYWKGLPGQPRYETSDENKKPIHSTRLFGNQTVQFLREAPTNRPFCLSVSFKAPHVQDGDPRQFIPDPAYEDLYTDVTIPPPKTATSAHYQVLPEFLRAETTVARKRWQLRFKNPELYQMMVKNYYRLISGVDAVLGRIRRELDVLKLAENTIIALAGDNGFYLGEYGLAGKWYGHEPSIRVPLILYDPRLPQSKRSQVRDELALNIDIAPTFLDYAGITPTAGIQGKSLLPLIRGKSVPWREDFLYEHTYHVPDAYREKVGTIPPSVGVRTQRYKYLRYFEEKPVFEELYYLEDDPHEEKNLVSEEAYTSIPEQLRKRCDELLVQCE